MQWLFDIVADMMTKAGFIKLPDVELYLKGMIVAWSGGLGDIPDGWAICDGNQGTPNLIRKFIIGPGPGFPLHATGGAFNHNHDFAGDGHFHEFLPGVGIEAGNDAWPYTSTDPAIGTTDTASSLPPYYVLAFIMKL